MDFSKIDFSLFRKTESSSSSVASSISSVSPRSRVRPAPKSSSSSLMRDGYEEDAKAQQAADEIFGLKQLSQSLFDVSKSLRSLHKGLKDTNENESFDQKEAFSSALVSTKSSMDILAKTPRIQPSVRIQMKSSLREIDAELSRAQDDLRSHSRRPFKQASIAQSEVPSWLTAIEEARKLAIQLRQEVDKRISGSVAAFRGENESPESGLVKKDRAGLALQKEPESLTTLTGRVTRSFVKSPEKSILAQGNPKRDSIVNLLYKERNLDGELSLERSSNWQTPSPALLAKTGLEAAEGKAEKNTDNSMMESD